MSSLHETILWDKLDDLRVRCNLCAHRCTISSGNFGACGVRQNVEGSLFTHVYGALVSQNIDPIEKKPLYHFLPGSQSYSVATIGCNFRCSFCQNWSISQTHECEQLRGKSERVPPDELVKKALFSGCKSLAFTYSEPTIFLEYALDTARQAHANDLKTVFVTNGYMTDKAIELMVGNIDACNIDLKAFSPSFYEKVCHARLEPVLHSIIRLREAGVWVEITTLIIPGFNDSERELTSIAQFLAKVDKNMPWHISRFHPDYKLMKVTATPIPTLKLAEQLGKAAGLRYVYIGNIPGSNETHCPKCKSAVVKRMGFNVQNNALISGCCFSCGEKLPGLWE